MASRLREPTEQELRDLAMTLAGEIDQRRSPITDPQTRIEAANILATVVNRFSTDEPMRFGRSQVRSYNTYSDVVRNAGQYNAWMGQHVGTTQRNYDANRDFWDSAVKDFFAGDLQPTAPNATHYHADFVEPSWSRSIDRVAQAGPHIFYNDERFMGRPLGERRPSYAMAAPTLAPEREGQPNPQGDLNQQELANIAPPTPANAMQMAQARTPNVPNPTARPSWAPEAPMVASAGPDVSSRTIGGYIANQSGFEVKPGATIDGLSPAAGNMLDLMANSRGSGFTVTEGRRAQNATYGAANSLHKSGNALDVRRRDRTDQQNLDMLNAALAGGAREVIFYPERAGGHVHFGARPSGRFSVSGPVPSYASQSDIFNRLQAGEQPRISEMVPGPTPRPAMLAQPQDPRATDFGPLPAETKPRLSDTYTRPSSLPQITYGPQNGRGGVSRPSQQAPSGSSSDTTARINQGFNDALAPRSTPSPVASVSPQGSYGTPRQRNSPDQFQYATAPTPSPAMRTETRTREVANPAYAAWESTYRGSQQKSPTDFQYAPQGPSRDAMLANYGARALQSSDPFASAPPAPPQTITERYQVSVPNPVARPTGPAPTPRGPQLAGVPNPVARPSSLPQRRSGIEQAFAGFNDWIGGRAGPIAGSMLGGALGGPIGALVGGLGGYGAQQAWDGNLSMPQVNLVQGAQLPTQNTPNWQDTTGLPTYASVTGNGGGTGASAHDAWADSLGSAFY